MCSQFFQSVAVAFPPILVKPTQTASRNTIKQSFQLPTLLVIRLGIPSHALFGHTVGNCSGATSPSRRPGDESAAVEQTSCSPTLSRVGLSKTSRPTRRTQSIHRRTKLHKSAQPGSRTHRTPGCKGNFTECFYTLTPEGQGSLRKMRRSSRPTRRKRC